MDDATHVIVTDEAEWGWSAESPQWPGFVYGRPTLTEFMQDYRSTLKAVGVNGRVVGHMQRRFFYTRGS